MLGVVLWLPACTNSEAPPNALSTVVTGSASAPVHSLANEVPRPLDLIELNVTRSTSTVSVLLRFHELTVQKSNNVGTRRDSYYINVDVGGSAREDYVATFDADAPERWRYAFTRTWDAGDDDGYALVPDCQGIRPQIDTDRDVVTYSFPSRCVRSASRLRVGALVQFIRAEDAGWDSSGRKWTDWVGVGDEVTLETPAQPTFY